MSNTYIVHVDSHQQLKLEAKNEEEAEQKARKGEGEYIEGHKKYRVRKLPVVEKSKTAPVPASKTKTSSR